VDCKVPLGRLGVVPLVKPAKCIAVNREQGRMQLLHKVQQMVVVAVEEPLTSRVGHVGGAALAIEGKVHDLAQSAA